MSMPFCGPPKKTNINKLFNLNKKLAMLSPKKKHYQYYFSSYKASKNIMHCSQGLKNFFRGYFHFKSADYKDNKPHKLKSFSAKEMKNMPEYYIMNFNLGMAQTIRKYMPTKKEIDNCLWLDTNDLNVYVKNFLNSGIQKSLYWYKVMLSNKEKMKIIKLNLSNSTKIPSIFISGNADWGIYQKPGDLENMESSFFKNYFGTFIIKNAGHWLQQEQPNKTFDTIINFYNKI
jgi:hypothetical protein